MNRLMNFDQGCVHYIAEILCIFPIPADLTRNTQYYTKTRGQVDYSGGQVEQLRRRVRDAAPRMKGIVDKIRRIIDVLLSTADRGANRE